MGVNLSYDPTVELGQVMCPGLNALLLIAQLLSFGQISLVISIGMCVLIHYSYGAL